MNVIGPNAPLPRIPLPASAATQRASCDATSAPSAEPSETAPTLWDLLTAEERDFFAQKMAMGPLTYRPAGAVRPPTAGPTGQRIDVRG
jgi:hypothetical protein